MNGEEERMSAKQIYLGKQTAHWLRPCNNKPGLSFSSVCSICDTFFNFLPTLPAVPSWSLLMCKQSSKNLQASCSLKSWQKESLGNFPFQSAQEETNPGRTRWREVLLFVYHPKLRMSTWTVADPGMLQLQLQQWLMWKPN